MKSQLKKDASVSGAFDDKTGEKKLKNLIGHMQDLLDSYPGNLFSVDCNYCYTAFNNTHAQLMQIIYGADIQLGHNLLDYFTSPAYREMSKQKLDQAMVGGEPFVDQEFSVKIAGSEVFTNVSYLPVKDENGSVIGVRVFSEDVTERKKSFEAAKNAQERYKAQFKNFPIPTTTWKHKDGDFILIDSNIAAESITAGEINDLMGKSVSELYGNIPNLLTDMSTCFNEHRTIRSEVKFPVDTTGAVLDLIVTYVYIPSDLVIVHTEDITQRKQDEEKLRMSEERLREILENVQDATYRRNLHTDKYDYMSPAIEKISGFTAEEMIAMTTETVLDQIHPDDRTKIEHTIQESIANPGKSHQVEYRFKHKHSGQYCWFQDRFTTTLGAQGQLALWYGSVRDISEQKQAEEKKQEAEFRYASLFEQSHDAIFILDLQGAHLVANQRAADLMGYTIEEMHGLSVNDTSAELQESKKVIQKLLNGEHIPLYERLFKKKDGTTFPVEINIELVRDMHGNPLHIQSVIRDISERKQAANKLRESEERWQFALEGAGDGVWDWNAKTNKVFYSRQWKLMLGYTDEEIGDTLDEWQKRVHPDDLPDVLEKINQHLERISPFYLSEHRLLCKDGSYKWIMDRGKVIEWAADKKPLRVIGTHRDITERKLAEKKLRESEERFRMLFETSQDAILISAPGGAIFSVNPAATRMFGMSEQEFIHSQRSEIVDTTDPSFPGTMKELLSTGKYTGQITFIRRDGSKFPGEISAVIFKDKNGMSKSNMIIRDVSERKLAEEKLRESEEKYRSFVKHSSDGITFVDELGNIVEWNHSNEKLSGLKKEDVIGKPYWEIQQQLTPPEFRTPEILQKFKAAMLEMIHTGQSPFFNRINNGVLIGMDGTRKIIEQIAFPVATKNGFGIRSLTRDVTARKLAEEKLRESEERFRRLFEHNHATMLIIDPESIKILDANPAASEFYGYSLNELRGMPIFQINMLPPETVSTEMQHAMKEERNYFVFPHRLAGGETRTVEVYSSPINLNGNKVLFSVIHDITKRKLAEEKLIESEELFATAFHSSQDAISITRLSDGIYLDVNDAFCSIFNIPREQIVRHTSNEFEHWVYPEKQKEFLQAIREKGHIQNYEFEYRSHTGRVGYLKVSADIVQLSGHNCLLIFGQDITIRKHAEAQLLAAHEELEQRVHERTAELQTAIASLEKAAKVKDEFLSIMGHELRTPLNIMLGSAQLLEEEVYGSLNDKQISAVNSIETSGENLLKLLNNILDLSTLQNGNISITIASCSLGDICRSVLKMTAASSEKKKQQVIFSITPDDIMLKADGLRLQQILLNLQSNAIKFTPDGGKIGIDVIGNRENKLIKIIVWDTGIGIKSEDLPRLFHPFMQLDARLSREYEGSGLGLALSKQLVELFGGIIHVESVFGEGSRFIVTLPWME